MRENDNDVMRSFKYFDGFNHMDNEALYVEHILDYHRNGAEIHYQLLRGTYRVKYVKIHTHYSRARDLTQEKHSMV